MKECERKTKAKKWEEYDHKNNDKMMIMSIEKREKRSKMKCKGLKRNMEEYDHENNNKRMIMRAEKRETRSKMKECERKKQKCRTRIRITITKR